MISVKFIESFLDFVFLLDCVCLPFFSIIRHYRSEAFIFQLLEGRSPEQLKDLENLLAYCFGSSPLAIGIATLKTRAVVYYLA